MSSSKNREEYRIKKSTSRNVICYEYRVQKRCFFIWRSLNAEGRTSFFFNTIYPTRKSAQGAIQAFKLADALKTMGAELR